MSGHCCDQVHFFHPRLPLLGRQDVLNSFGRSLFPSSRGGKSLVNQAVQLASNKCNRLFESDKTEVLRQTSVVGHLSGTYSSKITLVYDTSLA